MLNLKKTMMNKISPEASIYYEVCGGASHLDPRNKLAFNRRAPLTYMKMSKYDVSVSDIVLAGSLNNIVEQLILIYKRGNPSIYINNGYKSIKIWINKKDASLSKPRSMPFADAIIRNTGYLAIKGTGAQVGSTVATIFPALSDISTNAKIAGNLICENSAAELTSSFVNSVMKIAVKSKVKPVSQSTFMGTTKTLKNIKQIKNNLQALHSTPDVDFRITDSPYVPLQNDLINNRASRVAKLKTLVDKDYIIKIGSNFNRNHAGVVIDLATNLIKMDELINFLTIYEEEKKFVNCFLTSGIDDDELYDEL